MGAFLGVREVIGQINLLLECKTEMQLVFSLHFHSPHPWQHDLLVFHYLLPSLLHLPPQTDSVVLLKLLILNGRWGTLAKYSRIFMRRMMILRVIEEEAVRWKWKKVLEDGLREYWEFMGSIAGVRISWSSSS